MITQMPAVQPIEFKYVPPKPVASVNLAGSFNGWNKGVCPLKLSGDGRTWSTRVSVPFGRHQYKFVVDSSTWVTDPHAPNANDGNGNVNSVILVVPSDYGSAASPKDSRIAASSLFHEPKLPWVNLDRGEVVLRFRARPDDIAQLNLLVDRRSVPLTAVGKDDVFGTYEVRLPWNGKKPLKYTFQLKDGKLHLSYGASGLGSRDPFVLDAATIKPFRVPAWVEKGVVYQIFPDRFENGSKANDPQNLTEWGGKPTYSNRFGGDAIGVASKAGYLKDLGVKTVYFTPVLESPSNHRYDTTDYRKIDPQFGTNDEFAAMTQTLRKAGIRTVMDFAFNHSATNFAPFLDIRNKGAESKYLNWYTIKSFPVVVQDKPNYEAWYGFPSMPKLNCANPEVQRYVLDTVDFWRKTADIAGIRLDVANEVDMSMWRALRNHLKAAAPDAWILGEEWGDASAWLQGDQWDASMNYGFREIALQFVAKGGILAREASERLMGLYARYLPQVSRNELNLLSSHDTSRFLTECGGNEELHRLAAVMQLTWVGTPSVYYGEEIGMTGGADPDNRRTMDWSRATAQNRMLSFYQKLIRVRNSSPELQSGDPAILFASEKQNVLAYRRSLGKEQTIVVLNRSTQPQTISIPLPDSTASQPATPSGFFDILSGVTSVISGRQLHLTIPALSASVLQDVNRHRPSHQAARSSSAPNYSRASLEQIK